MTPAGTSNELDVQNGWEENTHTNSKYYSMYIYGITYKQSMDQPGKVANPARGQLNRENEYFPVPVRA